MTRRPVTHLVVAIAIVFGASWLAFADLGGAGGVMIPYQGTLFDGGAPVTSEVTLTFEVWTDDDDAGSRCLTQAKTFTPANGAFAVTLGPVDESCLKGEDLYLQILDPDGGTLGARQRVFPAVAAATSGSGDFHVGGTLSTGGLVNTGALTSNGAATLTGGAVVSGGGTRSLDVNGHTETNSLHVVGDSDLGAVTADSLAVSGTLSTHDLSLTSLSVEGEVRWDCPANTMRVGDKCVTPNRGPATPNTLVSYGDAVEDCHDIGMALCPLETIYACDQLNVGLDAPGTCGAITDLPLPLFPPAGYGTLTNTPFGDNGGGFTGMCFWSWYNAAPGAVPPIQNYRAGCSSGHFYFCCSPVNPTTL